MASYAITHESAVPTSASCFMRPTMTYTCMRCSLQSEHGHTLCCTEPARMYILHVRIKILGQQNGQIEVDCGYSPRRSSTSNSSARLTRTISVIVSYLTWHHSPKAWIRSQTSWLRRKRCTGDDNLHLHLAPWRMVTALY